MSANKPKTTGEGSGTGDGKMADENMELDDIVVQLARWYDVQFTFSASEYKKRRFTGVVRKYEDLNDVLDMIEKTTNVKFIINGRNVTITSVMK